MHRRRQERQDQALPQGSARLQPRRHQDRRVDSALASVEVMNKAEPVTVPPFLRSVITYSALFQVTRDRHSFALLYPRSIISAARSYSSVRHAFLDFYQDIRGINSKLL